MKIPLKHNLLGHLEGTDIAETYSLKNEGKGNDSHTVIDLDHVNRIELSKELKKLCAEVAKVGLEEQKRKKRDSAKIEVLQERQRVIRSAYQVIDHKTAPKKSKIGA